MLVETVNAIETVELVLKIIWVSSHTGLPQSCLYTFFNNENKNDNDDQSPKCSETTNEC